MSRATQVPNGWREVSIEEIALPHRGSIKIGPFGSQLKKSEMKSRGFKVYGQENVFRQDFSIGERFVSKEKFDALRSCRIWPGDLVITMMGTVGQVAIVPDSIQPGLIDSHLLRIQLDLEIAHADYIRQLLGPSPTMQRQIARLSQGGIMSGLNASIVKAIEVPLPSLPEQKKIAAILTAVDEVIEKTQAQIDKVKDLKRAMMQELLTRGVGHTEFKDSPVGRIPKAWRVVAVDDCSEKVVVGIVIQPAQYYQPQGVPMLRSANVTEAGTNLDNLRYMSRDACEENNKSMLKAGDLVTVRTGYPGTTAVVSAELEGANCIDLVITRPSREVIPYYLCYWVNSDYGKGSVLRSQGGLAQQHFNVGEMKKLLVALPGLDEQKQIVGVIRSVEKQQRAAQMKHSKARDLKKALMQDLLTGRVRVKVDA